MLKGVFLLTVLFFPNFLNANIDKNKTTPVLLVRGVDCTDNFLRPLAKVITDSGVSEVRYASFTPRFGQVGIDEIAAQIAEAASKLKEETQSDKIDVVGFSMGALASRYFIQKLSGKNYVRKFISISGPHNGTYAGYFRAFQKGIRDMLPGSDLISDLNNDSDPWGDVEVFSYYTPFDLVVTPSSTAILKGSVETKSFKVALHHQMIKDPTVLAEVVNDLKKDLPLTKTVVVSKEATKSVDPHS